MDKKITREDLKKYASKLMFDMNEDEYETLEKEFEIILKQMDLIGEIESIKDVEPMTFPFVTYERELRDDVVEESLSVNEVLANAKHTLNDQVKVPKVVE